MNDYRLYFHDREGHILSVAEFTAAGDSDARAHAAGLLSGEPGELWQLARKVEAFRGAQDDRVSSQVRSPLA